MRIQRSLAKSMKTGSPVPQIATERRALCHPRLLSIDSFKKVRIFLCPSFRNFHNCFFINILTLSFLSFPASHIRHQDLVWPCIIVRSIIYLWPRDYRSNFHQGQYLPGTKGVAYSSFLNPFLLSRSLLTLRPYPTILAEVTTYPAREAGGGGIVFLNPLILSGSLFTLWHLMQFLTYVDHYTC
jgi:hypothetical protein